jgi:hypothetical protein
MADLLKLPYDFWDFARRDPLGLVTIALLLAGIVLVLRYFRVGNEEDFRR